jgi:hypothetical protein
MLLPPSFQLVFLGAAFIVLVCMMITLFWKISIHMISIGGTIGLFMAIGFRYEWLLPQIILPLFFLAGIVGYARLRLEAHTPTQVYIGFITGWIVMFIGFFLLQ